MRRARLIARVVYMPLHTAQFAAAPRHATTPLKRRTEAFAEIATQRIASTPHFAMPSLSGDDGARLCHYLFAQRNGR